MISDKVKSERKKARKETKHQNKATAERKRKTENMDRILNALQLSGIKLCGPRSDFEKTERTPEEKERIRDYDRIVEEAADEIVEKIKARHAEGLEPDIWQWIKDDHVPCALTKALRMRGIKLGRRKI